jgi:hypothetical protein
VGGSVVLRAPSQLSFSAAQDVVFGPYSLIPSRPIWGERSVVTVQAGGDVLVMRGAVILAKHEVQVVATQGTFAAERGSGLVAASGKLQVYGGQSVSVHEGILKAQVTTVITDGDLLELRDGQVHAVPGADVGLYLIASTGTIDMTGTALYGFDADDIVIDATYVVR